MLMRVNIRCHIGLFSQSVLVFRSCAFLHFYELGGAGTLFAMNAIPLRPKALMILMPFGTDSHGPKERCIRWHAHWRRPASTIDRSVRRCGLTLPLL